jgi:hypothetical protein
MLLRLVDWLIFTRPEAPYIYSLVSHIHNNIRIHIYLRLHIHLHWYEPLYTDTSHNPEAYLKTPTAYQTDLSCEAHGTDIHATCILHSDVSDTLCGVYCCINWSEPMYGRRGWLVWEAGRLLYRSIHRWVHTHSHLYDYIYGLVALLDGIQSSFSSITISTGYEPGTHYNLYHEFSIYISWSSRASRILKYVQPSLSVTVATAVYKLTKTQYHHHRIPTSATSTFAMGSEPFQNHYEPELQPTKMSSISFPATSTY